MIEDENIKQSQVLLDEAIRALMRAQHLMSARDYSGVVEASQHCIEYSIQMIYRIFDLKHPQPRNHDVGIGLNGVMNRINLTEGYSSLKDNLSESLGRMRLISAMWSWAHSTSMYGCLNIPASKIFRESEAKIALDHASEAQSISATFLYNRKSGIIRVQYPTTKEEKRSTQGNIETNHLRDQAQESDEMHR